MVLARSPLLRGQRPKVLKTWNAVEGPMIATIILMIAVLATGLGAIALAKRGRNRRNFVAIPVERDLTLSTLADDAGIVLSLLGGNFTEDFYWISSDLSWSSKGATAGEGPIVVGLAHGDYTAAEIVENLDVAFLGPGTKIEQERARRLVRRVGEIANANSIFHIAPEGGLIRTKSKFMVQSGKAANMWVVNKSGAQLTTGQSIHVVGTIYGRWVV